MSPRQSDLERQASKFAGDLTELFNSTVTHGIRLRSSMDRHRNPTAAAEVLKRDGWRVIEPDAGTAA